jgi:ABC-type multidrug transport system fused ATPase/permease subunit
MISNGTIRANVGMGFPIENVRSELVMDSIKLAQLDEIVASLPLGIDSPLGDRGASISGGQRQRIGIARAMFTKPKLLIFDEATSSLDGETEASVTSAIQALKGNVTVVLIAHRLSTVREADLVFYMEEGEIVAHGTFAELRKKVPDFDRQAQLMGL